MQLRYYYMIGVGDFISFRGAGTWGALTAFTCSTLGTSLSTLWATPSTLGTSPSTLGATPSTLRTTPSTLLVGPRVLWVVPGRHKSILGGISR
mmetsp:Transcript_114169/g.198466  ORF Transcript_114169/g.198466 Transcript_114169/m.198466 type:complete len:93 (-) Transcript_114169:163-441(-)